MRKKKKKKEHTKKGIQTPQHIQPCKPLKIPTDTKQVDFVFSFNFQVTNFIKKPLRDNPSTMALYTLYKKHF